LPVFLASPSVVASFRPRLRIVFIMPGIENFAPERTLSSSGLALSPSFIPTRDSSSASDAAICSSTSSGTRFWLSKKTLQTSVMMVKPGGTGTPLRDISARPEPLPPSRSFIVPSPSAVPAPKL